MKENDESNSEEHNQLPGQESNPDNLPDGTVTDESLSSHGNKVRRRIRVRKRIRIRKKPSIKKKLKKFGEKAFWVVIVAGFITALVIMIIELDIRDDKFKQKKKNSTIKIDFGQTVN